eukprot:m.289371 g.289371  ORF g.289371 m.289371 type:complete len:332 (+) comp40715_c2_seq7:1737-2732(+)
MLLDGHCSHFSLPVIKKAAEQDVIIFCLPPHTTHLLQPFDRGYFGCLKSYWKEECQKYSTENMGQLVNRGNFVSVFSMAWRRAMIPKNVEASFRVTGIYPFNPKAVLLPGEVKKTPEKSICKESIMTMLTPRRRQVTVPPPKELKYQKVSFLEERRLSKVSKSPRFSELSDPTFSAAEIAKFQKWQIEGYHLPNTRYFEWKQQLGLMAELPTTSVPEKTSVKKCQTGKLPTLQPPKTTRSRTQLSSTVASRLRQPRALMPAPPKPRMMTSAENIKRLEEKAATKREKEKRKEERKVQRELKPVQNTVNLYWFIMQLHLRLRSSFFCMLQLI